MYYQNLMGWLEFALNTTAGLATVVSVVFGAYFTLRTARAARLDPSEQPGSITSEEVLAFETGGTARFETRALASYYNQVLSRANISFWFSLFFASVGFGVIILSFFTYSSNDWGGAAIKIISGTIIDGVAGLFFFQSTAAQKSMGEFFEKLRLDRFNAEARDMIKEIENIKLRDELRSQLILKYSGVEKLLVGHAGGAAGN